MRQLMVRYKVKPELAQENERLVRAVYDELEHSAPAGLRYATFKLEDGVSFVHFASIETDVGHNPLRSMTQPLSTRRATRVRIVAKETPRWLASANRDHGRSSRCP